MGLVRSFRLRGHAAGLSNKVRAIPPAQVLGGSAAHELGELTILVGGDEGY